MSWLQGISQAFGAAAAPANTQSLRDGVTVTIGTRHPTAEQLADAVIAELKLSDTDLAAYKQANNGTDFRDQLIADIKRDGIDYRAMQYLGNGKYAARVGMSAENKRNLIEWSKRDGDAYAPAARELTAKHAEVRVQGDYVRHKLEVQLRKQEALQQAAQDTGLAGAVTLAAQRTPQAIKDVAAQMPKVAPVASELLPPVIATGLVAGGVALGLDKQLELMVERQMEMVKSAPLPIATSKARDDAPPVTTAERPAPPDIKVAPDGGELVKPQAAPPAAPVTSGVPATPSSAPTNQPSAPQSPPPNNPLGKLVGPAIGTATTLTGIETEKAMKSSPFDSAINDALNSSEPGEVLEGKVATYVKPDIVAFQKKIGANGELGEIDVETDVAIIEVTTASKKKLDQIEKYLNNSTFNPHNKPVILYAPKYNRFAEQSIINAGAYVARNKEELLELLDKLKQQ